MALQALYPYDNGVVVDLSEDVVMCATFADLNAVRSVLSSHNETEALFKQKIQQRMGVLRLFVSVCRCFPKQG